MDHKNINNASSLLKSVLHIDLTRLTCAPIVDISNFVTWIDENDTGLKIQKGHLYIERNITKIIY